MHIRVFHGRPFPVTPHPWRKCHCEYRLPACQKTIHQAWLRKPVAREAFDLFREGLKRLFDRIDQGEPKEHMKRIVADFLTEV
jgi:hypothetical protein